MNALQIAARHRQVTRARGAAGQHERIELGAKLVHRHVDADVTAGAKGDAFFAQDLEPPVEQSLLQLEFRNAVAQQAAHSVGALEDRDEMAGPVQLIGGREACRA